MTDFNASLSPITVPSLASASANDLAVFQANFTSSIVNTGNTLLANYIALKNTDFYQVGDIPVLGPQLAASVPLIPTAPTRSDPAVDWATIEQKLVELAALSTPTAPTLTTTPVDVPVFEAAAPILAIPGAPSADVGPAPGNAPTLVDPAIPDAPVVVIPPVPTFDEYQLPSAPNFALQSFDDVAPQNLISPPTAQFAYVDTGYASDLHDPLVLKLLGDLQNGSYGIDVNDESQLWFRARDRAAMQQRTEVEEAMRRMAATSFAMPQGTVLEAIDQAEQKGQTILSEANREIALRRSELYVEGRKFTISQVQGYEKVRIDLYNATQERALNAAKATVELSVALFDATVKNYSAQLEGYKTGAQVFETKIRAELVKAEIYKSQLEAEKLRVDFNRAKIDVLNAQLNAIKLTVDVYSSRIQAANVLMQMQAQRVEVFRSQIQAYAERVRAKEAEYNIYLAQIKGQLAQVDVYRSQIDAYNARLAGLDTRSRIGVQNNETLLQSYRVASQLYSSQLESFNKQIGARLDEAKTKGVLYGIDADVYKALSSSIIETARVQNEGARYNLDWNRASLAAKVAQVEFRLRQLGLSVDLQKDVNKNGVEFLRSALAGSVSGLNALGVSTSTT